MKSGLLSLIALFAAGILTGCDKDSGGVTVPEGPSEPEVPPVTATYEVGDYYNEGFVKGIVVHVAPDGKSGTVVSLDETEAAWSYKYEEPTLSFPLDGRYNTDCVYEMEGWRENYPGFLWCSRKDVMGIRKWYVPCQKEMWLLYQAYSGVKGENRPSDEEIAKNKREFNKALEQNGGIPLSDAVYWTSDEFAASMAYAFDMKTGSVIEVPRELDKKLVYRFRVMADFKL